MATLAIAGTSKTKPGAAAIASRPASRSAAPVMTGRALTRYEDPLDADRADDVAVAATRRSLCRVALIASEVGARFQRENTDCDPMAWMLTPRRLFSGGAAIEACLDRDNFSRALLLHGLGIGMDAEPGEIDGLLDNNDGESGNQPQPSRAEVSGGYDLDLMSIPATMLRLRLLNGENVDSPEGAFDRKDKRRLYSATVVYQSGGIDLIAFHASLANGYDEMFERLLDRFGGSVAAHAQVRVGFDPKHPLLPRVVARLLSEAERCPDNNNTMNLNVNFERRFEI